MNMSGVAGGAGMSGMAGCSGSQHSKMTGGAKNKDSETRQTSLVSKGQAVSVDPNWGKKLILLYRATEQKILNREGRTVMKKFTKLIFASLMVAFALGAVVSPAMTPAFAATQSTDQTADQEQQKPPADEKGSNSHSGHHG